MITGRIDRLGADAQVVLKIGSVIGRVFGLGVLSALSPDAADPKEETRALVRHDLVLPEPPAPDPAWIFKHALVRDAAYGLLIFAQRRSLHREAAEWFEQREPERHFPVLAHHYTLAEVPDKARQYLGLAGERALATGASAEAVGFLQRALELDEEGSSSEATLRRARWWRQLGLGYYALGRKREARDAMLATLRLVGRPLRSSTVGLLIQLMGEYARQARWLVAPAGRVARNEHDRALAAEAADAAQYVSTTYYFDKENLPFFVAGLKCASEAARAGVTPASAVGLAYVGVLAGLFQIDALTMTYFRRSLAIALKTGDGNALARHWQLRAMQRAGVGAWIDAELADATEFFARTGDRHELEVSLTVQALLTTYRAEYGDAAARYRRMLASARGHSVQHTIWGIYKLGELMLLERGRHDEALAAQEEALELLRVEPEEPVEAAVGWLVGTCQHRRGDAAASDTIHAAFQRVKESPPNTHGMLLAYTFGIWTLLDILAAAPSKEAHRRVKFGLSQMAIFTFLFPVARGRLNVLKARYALARGKATRARKLLADAEARGERRGMRLDVALARAVRGDNGAQEALEALGAPAFWDSLEE